MEEHKDGVATGRVGNHRDTVGLVSLDAHKGHEQVHNATVKALSSKVLLMSTSRERIMRARRAHHKQTYKQMCHTNKQTARLGLRAPCTLSATGRAWAAPWLRCERFRSRRLATAGEGSTRKGA